MLLHVQTHEYEVGDSHDPLTVAVKQMNGQDTILGHVSQRISVSCNAFMRHGGITQCTAKVQHRFYPEWT